MIVWLREKKKRKTIKNILKKYKKKVKVKKRRKLELTSKREPLIDNKTKKKKSKYKVL